MRLSGTGPLCSGKRVLIWSLLPVLAAMSLVPANNVLAASWRLVKKVNATSQVSLVSGGQIYAYCLLTPPQAAVLSLTGPRRLKIASRYLFPPGQSGETSYRIVVRVDGQDVLSRSLKATVKDDVSLRGEPNRVGSLRRCYVEIGKGTHEVEVHAETSAGARVAARFYQESRRKKVATVAYAPETYGAVVHLQFASGTQSTYYHFDGATPLAFSVIGPTTLRIYTRLDFDHTMNGTQAYSLQVARDGEVWKTYHYQVKKLSAASYVERPEVLPGTRKTIRVPVPKGKHRYEIRCTRPEFCGVAAQIRIPKSGLALTPQ